jgi:hypothetical protein
MAEVRAGELVICAHCRHLRGPVPDRTDGVQQLCACTPVEVRRAQPRWGGDHNTYAELCRCCGLELLPSGSKWSVWLCEPCKTSVRNLNASAGRCVIPIGRHSMMNGVAARAVDLATDEAIDAFTRRLTTFVERTDFLDAHARAAVQRNLLALGFALDDDVLLADYLNAVEDASLSRESAFAALVAAVESSKLADGAH